MTTDYGRTDIVRERYDAGVRRGQLISKDMIALRIGPDIPMTVVATPAFLARYNTPEKPHELAEFPCINLHLPTYGELFSWQFRKGGKDVRVTTSGQIVLTSLFQIRSACLAGLGLTWLPLDFVASRIATGELIEVLTGWRKTFEPYHFYYPNRRPRSSAMTALINALSIKRTKK
ncbi:hypothetical protein AZ09_09400 [Acetobacter aceti 1023]|nr:hypothetical protein AZ09_09400 [Acetobacter aceti 1023]